LTDLNGRLLFTAEDYIHGQELWIETLDEDSAKMLKDIRHGPDGSYPIFLTNIDRKNKVVFAAVDSAHGTELWVTDGTPDSTKLLKEFTPGEMGTRFTQIVGHRRGAFFAISLEESVELWRTDGSETGTQRVRSFPLNTKIYLFENTKQFVYFVERNSNGTNRLWITDGSVAGTQPLTSFCPCNNPPYTIRLAEHQGKIYFDGSSLQSHQLWTSNLTDGYAAPVQQAEHIVPVRFAIYHNKVYFVGQDTNSNVSVWHTDGTDQGTISMPGTLGNPDFNNLVSAGDNLFYITQDLQFGLSSLWVLNRSEEPLISPANQLMGIRPQDAISVNNDLYFPATDGSTGYELWRSTGTIDSTYLVQDLNTGSGSAYPRNFIHIGRRLYFVADHLTRGTEVFYIDVSEAVKKSVPVSPTIFPNPAGNTVSVQVSEEFSDDWLKVDVYNMQGAKLISKRLESNVLTLDLSLLPPGVYLVRVNNSHGSRLIKL
jgi:ELWxxDGT repeat protein